MQTKLTLRLDEMLIQQAKKYAKKENKSLSQVVADYFQALTKQPDKQHTPPITASLIGILDEKNINEDDYKKYLTDKYR